MESATRRHAISRTGNNNAPLAVVTATAYVVLCAVLFTAFLSTLAEAWQPSPAAAFSFAATRRGNPLHMSSEASAIPQPSSGTASSDAGQQQEEEDDDDEYEYVELEFLTEKDLATSEWLVGTNWDNNPNQIAETWCRLAVDEKGQNIAIWGDGAEGKWNLDVASQFLSISKENVFQGKRIWACTIDDYYYLQGTVRGWNFLQAASVLGQWQAKRLGVDPEEAGVAPWFQEDDDGEGQSEDSGGADK